MAGRHEIRAVRKVLYDRKRLRKMLTELRSIDILMNTNPYVDLEPDDIRVTAGAGPTWIVPSTGEVDPAVLEAATRCKRVAELLRDTRRELKQVEFDRGDKRHLRKALDEHAKAWVARADEWSRPGIGADPEKAAAAINRHDAKALRNYDKAKDYLDRNAFEGVL